MVRAQRLQGGRRVGTESGVKRGQQGSCGAVSLKLTCRRMRGAVAAQRKRRRRGSLAQGTCGS